MELKYVVKREEDDIRRILAEELKISKYQMKKVNEKNILVNGKSQKLYLKVHKNDIISVNLGYDEDNSNIVPNKNIKLDILYEDEWLIIVNKPKFMPVHPTMRHYEDSLSNGIKYYYDQIGLHKKIRPVNRLDKNTSGIVMFAKSEYIQSRLKKYKKEYLAIVEGKLEGSGTINKKIARKEGSIIERCIDDGGQEAITHYEAIRTYEITNNVETGDNEFTKGNEVINYDRGMNCEKVIKDTEFIKRNETINYNKAMNCEEAIKGNEPIKNDMEIKDVPLIKNGMAIKDVALIKKDMAKKDIELIKKDEEIKSDIFIENYSAKIKCQTTNPNKIDYTLVKCSLETGKTHQIRVHLASIGHPILGDSLYGKESILIDRQALHAYKITFIHPVTKEKVDIIADLPSDMKKLLKILEDR